MLTPSDKINIQINIKVAAAVAVAVAPCGWLGVAEYCICIFAYLLGNPFYSLLLFT